LKTFGKGSSAAWETEELFAENRDGLVRYLRHHLDDASAAEDLAQECFVRFFQARTRDEEISQARAWLFRVAHNLVIDYGRKKRPDLLDDDAWRKLMERTANGAIEQLEARTEVSHLPWHRLTELELECLRLRSEGLKFREVGQVLGISISTVASYVARAVKKLQGTETGDREAPKHGRTAAPR